MLLLPRLIRLRDAPAYLGMGRNRFNAEVRPCVTEIPKVLLGHKSGDITMHYSAPEIAELLEAANRVAETRVRTLLRVMA
jgi:hypothetical protein